MIDPYVKTALDGLRAQIDALEALLVQPDQPAPPTGTTLRLLQWNTHHDALGTDGKYDPDRFCAAVAKINPDLCSFNELSSTATASGFLSRIKQRLGGPWTLGYDGRGNALMTHLPATYERVLIDQALTAHMEIATVAIHGRTLRIGSTHLHVSSAASRLAEVKAMLAAAPDIVLGDFNMQPGSPEYLAMIKGGYVDVWTSATTRIGDGNTKNTRIDYGFVRGDWPTGSVVSAEVIDVRDANGVMPSDHRPLVMTVTV